MTTATLLDLARIRNVRPNRPTTFVVSSGHGDLCLIASVEQPLASKVPVGQLWLCCDPTSQNIGLLFESTGSDWVTTTLENAKSYLDVPSPVVYEAEWKGPKGFKGPDGLKGQKGPKGPKGPTGNVGDPLVMSEVVPAVAAKIISMLIADSGAVQTDTKSYLRLFYGKGPDAFESTTEAFDVLSSFGSILLTADSREINFDLPDLAVGEFGWVMLPVAYLSSRASSTAFSLVGSPFPGGWDGLDPNDTGISYYVLKKMFNQTMEMEFALFRTSHDNLSGTSWVLTVKE